EAERADIDLRAKLPDAVDPSFAAHWAETLTFLHIVTDAWPDFLAESGLMNPAARQVALLRAQAQAWADTPPADPVLVAGVTAGIPAVADLLRVVARLPTGQVVLPTLDLGMSDSAWAALDESHAQAGLARLLADLGATRGDVQPWPVTVDSAVPTGRFDTLSRALLPAGALSVWREPTAVCLDGLSRLNASDQQGEAEAVAAILRDALETPGARAALVTPDRELAARVAAALLRYGVVADDSAGEPLAETPPAVFLRLLARTVAEELAPVPLLSLLKHPLAAAGLYPAACRAEARELEVACLRGPRPSHGIAGLRMAVDKLGDRGARLRVFLAQLESCLAPLLRVMASVETPPVQALAALIAAAEALAATVDETGPARLWSGEDGEAMAERLSSVRDAIVCLPDQPRSVLPGLLDAVLEGAAVRSRRAVRGRGGVEHPRIFIWGLLEARLQSVDRLVLGGLAETVWPPQTDPGPWLSRPMRRVVGLPSPEEIVGQAAHDFLAAATSAREVVLSCPARRDRAPAVPARWLTRLEMFLAGQGSVPGGLALPEHPAAAWTREMDLPTGGPRPVSPPRPAPPVELRPRQLSVTRIETWLRDPYAIYARSILRLEKLKPLDEETDAADYGSLVHDGVHRFLHRFGATWPPAAAAELRRDMRLALAEAKLRSALVAWWEPRLMRIADWIAETEAVRRAVTTPTAIRSEASGHIDLVRPYAPFRLSGRADRIEAYADGTLAILDYKTGTPPSQADADKGLAAQLLLEAVMAAQGAFGPTVQGEATELVYWHLTGGFEPGKVHELYRKKPAERAAAIARAYENLCRLIDDFDTGRPYLSHPHPDWAPRFADYAQLARVAEWSAAGDDA
ncbi:MAG: double-strand break repair protein AddB, partial [Acetobacteraceae bacterium]